jgi:hypothetical protein
MAYGGGEPNTSHTGQAESQKPATDIRHGLYLTTLLLILKTLN